MTDANFRAGGKEGRPSPRDGWRTPAEFYAAYDARFRFTLDAACSTFDCLAPDGICQDMGHDALAMPWVAESVWLNPPYSRVEPWLEKAMEEADARRAGVVVALIPCDPSTGWWRRHVAPFATRIEFVAARLRFRAPDGASHETTRGGGGQTTPSAVVIYSGAGGPPSYGYVTRQGIPMDWSRRSMQQMGLNLPRRR